MRKLLAGFAAMAFAAALALPVSAAVETVKGQLVDQGCYTKDAKNVGAAHQACMQTCAKKGLPVALVTSDGKVYTITGPLAADNNAKLVGHMSHNVELTGDVTTKDGKMQIAASDLKMAK